MDQNVKGQGELVQFAISRSVQAVELVATVKMQCKNECSIHPFDIPFVPIRSGRAFSEAVSLFADQMGRERHASWELSCQRRYERQLAWSTGP